MASFSPTSVTPPILDTLTSKGVSQQTVWPPEGRPPGKAGRREGRGREHRREHQRGPQLGRAAGPGQVCFALIAPCFATIPDSETLRYYGIIAGRFRVSFNFQVRRNLKAFYAYSSYPRRLLVFSVGALFSSQGRCAPILRIRRMDLQIRILFSPSVRS